MISAGAGTPLRISSSEYDVFRTKLSSRNAGPFLQLRNQRVINDEVLRRIQRDIDLAEERLSRHK